MNSRIILMSLLAAAATTAACSSSERAGASGASGGAGAAASDGSATSCAARSCAQAGATCGKAPDGCGGVLECGECPQGSQCGGGGVNACGSSSCVARTCGPSETACGIMSDGCGSVIDCGACQSPPPAACNWAAGVSIGAPVAISLPGITYPSEPVLSSDQRNLYFTEFWSEQRIHVARRPSSADDFGPPALLDWANLGWYSTQRYFPTRDGNEVFLTASKVADDDLDIYRARRDSPTSAWSEWEPVADVNTSGHENNAVVTWDGLSMYLTRNNGDDIFVARRSSTQDLFGAASLVSELSDPAVAEASPSLTSDELTIVFSRNIGGNGNVLHYATRSSRTEAFGAPAPVPGAAEKIMFGFIREDGCELYFVQTEPWQLYRAAVNP